MKKITVLLLLFILSCQSDVENITIEGVVTNKLTNKPLNSIDIRLECWYYGKSVDESYNGKYDTIVKTNKNGEYFAKFKKGTFVYIEVEHTDFVKIEASKHLRWRNYTINIDLKPK